MSKLVPIPIRARIDTLNSTTTPLGIGGVFTGQWVNIIQYGIIYINVYSDVASATDGLLIEQSSDGVNADHEDAYTVPAGRGKTYSINPYAKYMRIDYTNGAVAQTEFRLQVIVKQYGLPSSHRIQDAIVNDDDAQLVKSVLTGQDPSDEFINFRSTRQGNFRVSIDEYGDTPSIDAFERLRTSTPYTIFDSKQLHDKQPLFWDENLGGAATSIHSSVNANVLMSVTANASDYVIRQTKQRFNYQPGKGQLVLFTFYAPQSTGATQRIGCFDGTGLNYLTPNNGIFLELSNNIPSWNVAKNGSISESVTQANWNYDPMDGTGKSGITLDLSGCHIGIIDFEWLGVGRIRCGWIIGGIIQYSHYFNHANLAAFTSVYMSTPNLPLRYEIQTDGSTSGQLDHNCSTVISEGGLEETGILRSVDTGTTHVDANTTNTIYAILGIRLKTSYKDITVVPQFFSMINETADDFRWSLCLNPTIAGTFAYSDVTNSAIQYATGATANTVSSEGVVIDSGYAVGGSLGSGGSSSRKFETSLRMGALIDGTTDQIVLCATPLSANADIHGSLTIRELL